MSGWWQNCKAIRRDRRQEFAFFQNEYAKVRIETPAKFNIPRKRWVRSIENRYGQGFYDLKCVTAPTVPNGIGLVTYLFIRDPFSRIRSTTLYKWEKLRDYDLHEIILTCITIIVIMIRSCFKIASNAQVLI
jgi:hypothetical protein